jgi:N-acyl-D-aspartate/D-glutamate deacylase
VLGESSSVAPRDGLPVTTEGGVSTDWTTFTDYFRRVEEQGTAINLISHMAFEQIRRIAVGYSTEPATPSQLDRMRQLAERSMREGAWGMVLRFESGVPAGAGDRRPHSHLPLQDSRAAELVEDAALS